MYCLNMILNNCIYKIKNNISPFKTAIFTVAISVIASVSVSAVSEIGKQIMTEEMNSIGLNGMAAVVYNSKGENITDTKFYNNISSLNETRSATPVITSNVSLTFSNNLSVPAMCWGINDKVTDVISLEVIDGRMINQNDICSNSRVCLVDEKIAYTAYRRNNIYGKKIKVNIDNNTTEFTIIGTIHKNSNVLNSITGDVIPDFIYIPYSTMMNLSSKPAFDQVIFTSNNTEVSNNNFKNNIIESDHRYSNSIINITDLSNQKEQIIRITDTAFLSLFIVSCVAVVVCSLSVAASVNTAVISKQKDIGIKMSMGAGSLNIISEFLLSAVMSCMVGIIAAVLFMYIVFKILMLFIPWKITVDIGLIGISVSATIILTTFFSFLPSCRAAKMPPIKALNRE